jgi:hypothetical protein
LSAKARMVNLLLLDHQMPSVHAFIRRASHMADKPVELNPARA